MSNELNLVVARVKIIGDLHIEQEAPEVIEGQVGDRLTLKFPFNFIETSSDEDHFRVQLTSDLAGHEEAPAVFQHRDRRGIIDDQRGFISQTYQLPAQGEHTLNYRVAAELEDGDHREVDELTGSVRIVVGPAGAALL